MGSVGSKTEKVVESLGRFGGVQCHRNNVEEGTNKRGVESPSRWLRGQTLPNGDAGLLRSESHFVEVLFPLGQDTAVWDPSHLLHACVHLQGV